MNISEQTLKMVLHKNPEMHDPQITTFLRGPKKLHFSAWFQVKKFTVLVTAPWSKKPHGNLFVWAKIACKIHGGRVGQPSEYPLMIYRYAIIIFIFKISLSPKFWKYHTILIMRYTWGIHALWIAFNVLLKYRSLSALGKRYQWHELAYSLPLLCIWCIRRVHYVFYSCISRVSHYLLTNFALIMSHEISQISCDYWC